MTEQEVANKFVKTLHPKDAGLLFGDFSGYSTIEKFWIMNTAMREIRNHYRLWIDSPLTQKWRERPDLRDIRDGVDYSTGHPDAVSQRIFELARKIYKAGLV